MKFRKIVLENFGPYYGTHEIDLTVNDNNPIILFHGENMRGKTSLLRAFRFALYGRVKSQDGRTLIHKPEFPNWDARDEGEEFTCSVLLQIEDQNKNYTLKRWMKCQQSEISPNEVDILSDGVELIPMNENPVPGNDIPQIINSILHESISDFFLFDGESLQEVEEKLKNPISAVNFLQNSIEQILGLPALTTIISDLEQIHEDLSKDLKKIVGSNNAAKKALKDIDLVENQLQQKQKDAESLENLRRENDAKRRQLEPAYKAQFLVDEKLKQREEKQLNIKKLESERDALLQENSYILSMKWWMPLYKELLSRKSELQLSINELVKVSSLENKIQQLLNSVDNDCCNTCGQKLGHQLVLNLKREINDMEKILQSKSISNYSSEELNEKNQKIETLLAISKEMFLVLGNDKIIKEKEIETAKNKSQLNSIDQELRGSPTEKSDVVDKYLSASTTIENCDNTFPQIQKEIEILKSRLKSLKKDVSATYSDDLPLKNKINTVDHLINIFEKSVTEFSSLMRAEVEKIASELFVKLTSEPDFVRLQIDSNYYLKIVDKNERIVTIRSAGAEQIVAMSLISALIKCAVKSAPVIMDTPFGRLDKTHRENLLTMIDEMASQVLLFVTSTEFSKDYYEHLSGKIASEYTLNRLGASRTEIIRKNLR